MLELFGRMQDVPVKHVANTEHADPTTINQTLPCIRAHCLPSSATLKRVFLGGCNEIKFYKIYFITVRKK